MAHEAKHTPGPWRVGGPTEFINQVTIEPAIGCVYGAGEELKANARLIAAAPGLLEAARANIAMTFEEARAAHDAGCPKLYCGCDALNPCWALGMPITSPLHHWGDPETGPACDECTLRTAIAKATGAAQ